MGPWISKPRTRELGGGIRCAVAALALSLSIAADAAPKRAAAKARRKTADRCQSSMQFKQSDWQLQRSLNRAIDKLGYRSRVKRGQLAFSVVDLSDEGHHYYAGINDDKMMYAASLPKIAILLSVVESAKNRELTWRHELDARLKNMIVRSSNVDATWGAHLVGLKKIEQVMRDPKYCFYDDNVGGLWVGRPYGHSKQSNRDPLFNLSHGATSRQAARFYAMLNEGELVSPHWSFRMQGLMSPPAHSHKFVGALKNRPGVEFLARKSGTWRHFHADSALIQHYGSRYVIVGLSEHREGEKMMRKLAEEVDSIIMKGRHRARASLSAGARSSRRASRSRQ